MCVVVNVYVYMYTYPMIREDFVHVDVHVYVYMCAGMHMYIPPSLIGEAFGLCIVISNISTRGFLIS